METRKPIPLFVAGLFALLFLVLLTMIYSASTRATRFERNGVDATAVFVSGRSQRTNTQPDKPPRLRYYATVTFEAAGRRITVETQVTRDFLRAVEPGARIPLRYLPDDPESVLVDPLFESRSMALAWMFLLFFAGCLIIPPVQRWRKTRRAERTPPEPRARPKAGPLPRWVRVTSVILMICALGSFFTLSIWLRYAVEAWALPHIGWVSLPLAMASMFVPPVGFGVANLAMIWGVQRFRRVG